MSKNDELYIKNKESCIKDKECCIKTKEFDIKNDEFCRPSVSLMEDMACGQGFPKEQVCNQF